MNYVLESFWVVLDASMGFFACHPAQNETKISRFPLQDFA
jgi:hypothetical protein